MSTVYGPIKCPLCGYDPSSESWEMENAHIYNYRMSEESFVCSKCGLSWATEVIESHGKRFWRETYDYPIDESGRVLRPGDGGQERDGEPSPSTQTAPTG